MVARLFDGCGVLPSGIMTSHITRTPFLRVLSGNTLTGFSTQSELLPSACRVELPSNPHIGSSSSLGNSLKSLIWVFPRRLGTGVYPSSQRYSSLYLVMQSLSFVYEARTPVATGAVAGGWSRRRVGKSYASERGGPAFGRGTPGASRCVRIEPAPATPGEAPGRRMATAFPFTGRGLQPGTAWRSRRRCP